MSDCVNLTFRSILQRFKCCSKLSLKWVFLKSRCRELAVSKWAERLAGGRSSSEREESSLSAGRSGGEILSRSAKDNLSILDEVLIRLKTALKLTINGRRTKTGCDSWTLPAGIFGDPRTPAIEGLLTKRHKLEKTWEHVTLVWQIEQTTDQSKCLTVDGGLLSALHLLSDQHLARGRLGRSRSGPADKPFLWKYADKTIFEGRGYTTITFWVWDYTKRILFVGW